MQDIVITVSTEVVNFGETTQVFYFPDSETGIELKVSLLGANSKDSLPDYNASSSHLIVPWSRLDVPFFTSPVDSSCSWVNRKLGQDQVKFWKDHPKFSTKLCLGQ